MLMKQTESVPEYGIDVRKSGAAGDGISDDSGSIQNALDSGKELVVIPEGTYKIGRTLLVSSHTHIKAHPNARIFLADNSATGEWSFLLANKDAGRGNSDISINGGIWDGNNQNNVRGGDEAPSYSGVMMNFINVSGLTLSNLILTDPDSYYVRMGEVRDFLIEHVCFESPHVRPNQDGIHLGGFCSDGTIRHITATAAGVTGDDLVALNADDHCLRTQNRNLKCGSIRRIRISHLSAVDCHSFVRLLSVWSPIEEIDIFGLKGACRVCALNADASRECVKPVMDPKGQFYNSGVGYLENITIRDVDVFKSGDRHASALFDLRSQMQAFSIADFRRDMQADKNHAAPGVRIAQVRPSTVRLSGVEKGQIQAIADTSRALDAHIRPQPSENSTEAFRAEYRMGLKSEFILPGGGFDTLEIDSTGIHA